MGQESDFVRGVFSVLLKTGVLHNAPCEIRRKLIRKKCIPCHYRLNQCFNSVLERKVSVCYAVFRMCAKDGGGSSVSRRTRSWFCWSIRGLSERYVRVGANFQGAKEPFSCWFCRCRRWGRARWGLAVGGSGNSHLRVPIAPCSRYVSRRAVSLSGQAVLSFTE